MTEEAPRSSQPQLIRAIGRWSMVALAINSMLGSGIFGLPSSVAGLLGRVSPLAVLLAGAGTAVIMACYAEVASQFAETGGTYLYVKRAFGRLLGIEVGWMSLLTRLTACAASVNLLIAYLGEFWPTASQRLPRLITITALVGALAAVNYRGVGAGTLMSNGAVIAKLAVLAVLAAAGLAWLTVHPALAAPAVHAGGDAWMRSMLLLFFLYGGYEAALNPMGEAKNPRRDVVFALFTALAILTVLYCTLQLIVVAVLADPARSERPLADAARVLMGGPGAVLITLGALISIYGFLSANFLTVPRGLFALAERGDFPAAFAAVHPRWRTPYVSIAVFAVLVWLFSQFANFAWNVTLSVVSRTFYYAAVCAAVPVLRRLQPEVARFRLPGGLALPITGIAICALLLTRADFSKSMIVLLAVATGLINWALVRERGSGSARAWRSTARR